MSNALFDVVEPEKLNAMGSHERPGQGSSNDWLTPRWILDALGPFDLDVSASETDPTRCASRFFTWRSDGLAQTWNGFVWCNPPYGPHAGKFLLKLSEHSGGGIALVFARTETKAFNPALARASCVLFIAGRLAFERANDQRPTTNAGAPSMLLGYGAEAKRRLETCSIPGVRLYPLEAT